VVQSSRENRPRPFRFESPPRPGVGCQDAAPAAGGRHPSGDRRTLDGVELPSAGDRRLREAAVLLAELAPRHGISTVQLGADPAELVVTLEEGPTYFDLAEFDADADALLSHRVSITSSWRTWGSASRVARSRSDCMSRPAEVATQFDAAIHGVEEVRRVVIEDSRAAFAASKYRSRALAFCWVSTVSALRHYAQTAGAPRGTPPLSAPIRFRDRLAHQRLDKLDLDLLLETSVRDDPLLLRGPEERARPKQPRAVATRRFAKNST